MNQIAVEGKWRIVHSVIALSITVILLLVAWRTVSGSSTLSCKEVSASFDVTISELSVAVMAFLLLLLIINAAFHLQAGLFMLRPNQPAAARFIRNLVVLAGLGVGYAGMRAMAIEFMYGFSELYNYGFMILIGSGILLTLLDLAFHAGEVTDALILRNDAHAQAKVAVGAVPDMPSTGATVYCTSCGACLAAGAAFCGGCGTPVVASSSQEATSPKCSQCGQVIDYDIDFCTSCGHKLH